MAFKGQRYVIEALAQLKAAGRTDVEYRLAGGGDPTARRELAQRLGVAEQVVFAGSLPHDAVSRGSTCWICISSRARSRQCPARSLRR